jgi:hypothetical protein
LFSEGGGRRAPGQQDFQQFTHLAYLRAEGQRFRAAEEQALLDVAALRRRQLGLDAELAGVGIAVLEAAMGEAFEPARESKGPGPRLLHLIAY